MLKRRKGCLEHFHVKSYLEDAEWILYLSDVRECIFREDDLSLLNHFTRNQSRQPFCVKFTPKTSALVDTVISLKKTILYQRDRWVNSSFHHLRWLKVITDEKLPIICHLMYKSKKMFLYLLELNPTSVLEGLDTENTPFKFAVNMKYFWYYSQMLKKLTVSCEELQKDGYRGSVARYKMYYPAYKAIREAGFDVLGMISYSHNDNHLIYLLKILWKCEKIRQENGETSREDYDFYTEIFFKTRSNRVVTFLTRRKLLWIKSNLFRIMNQCIMYNYIDALRMLLIQVTQENLNLAMAYEEETNFKWNYCFSPLMYAIHYNNYEAAKILVDFGTDVNTSTLESPLMFAIDISNKNIVKLLLDSGADVNYHLTFGFQLNMGDIAVSSALEVASKNGDHEIIEMLFRYTDIHDDNDVALTLYQNFMRKNSYTEEQIALRTKWWRRLKSIHVVDTLLSASAVIEREKEEEGIMLNFYNQCPGVFEVCLETICEML